MKKMLSVFLSLLILLSVVSMFGASAKILSPKLTSELSRRVMALPGGYTSVLVTLNSKTDGTSYTQQEIEEMLKGHFGQYMPEDLVYEDNRIKFSAGNGKIKELCEEDMVLRIQSASEYYMTPEEREHIGIYYEEMNIPEEERSENDVFYIYGRIGDVTLCEFEKGDVAYPTVMEYQTIGDVFFVRGHGMPKDNPCGILVFKRGVGYRTLTEVYEAGEIDIMEVWGIIPFAYLVGDVNVDNEVNVKDATFMQKKIAKGETKLWECEPYFEIYNVNCDEEFNVKDATLVQKKVAGIA